MTNEIKITEKSTKAQIKEAYDLMVAKCKELEAMNDSPVTKAKAEAKKASMDNAEKAVENPVFAPEIIKQYNDLKVAITEKETYLNELYGIEAEAGKMAAMINAHKAKKIELEAEFADKKAELEKQIKDKKAEVAEQIAEQITELSKTKKTLEAEEKEYKVALAKARAREKEEYEYDLKIAQKKDADKWATEKAERETIMAKRIADVIARENAVKEQEEEIAELKAKVAEIPALIANAEESAAKITKNKVEASYAFEKKALEKDAEHEKAFAEAEIERLKEQNATLITSKIELEAKLDKAYAEMKSLAAETVKAGATVKVVSESVK